MNHDKVTVLRSLDIRLENLVPLTLAVFDVHEGVFRSLVFHVILIAPTVGRDKDLRGRGIKQFAQDGVRAVETGSLNACLPRRDQSDAAIQDQKD